MEPNLFTLHGFIFEAWLLLSKHPTTGEADFEQVDRLDYVLSAGRRDLELK